MKKVIKFLPLVAAVIGLLAVMSLFLPAFVYAGNEFLGSTTVFGYTKETAVGDFDLLSFSFMNLLTYLLVLVGIVCAVLAFLKKDQKLFAWGGAACLLLAGVFFFCVIPFTSVADQWQLVFLAKADKSLWELGYGAILAGISSILSAIVLVGSKLLK
ncbi:MAG: hypothetical protein IJ506_08560 [Clostridia bacterium]|nr:hypothetical protein [Clostridia bacterium]